MYFSQRMLSNIVSLHGKRNATFNSVDHASTVGALIARNVVKVNYDAYPYTISLTDVGNAIARNASVFYTPPSYKAAVAVARRARNS